MEGGRRQPLPPQTHTRTLTSNEHGRRAEKAARNPAMNTSYRKGAALPWTGTQGPDPLRGQLAAR